MAERFSKNSLERIALGTGRYSMSCWAAEVKVRQLYGDSATFDYGPYKGECDIVFVEGAHSLAYAACDTEGAFQLVRPGGVARLHCRIPLA